LLQWTVRTQKIQCGSTRSVCADTIAAMLDELNTATWMTTQQIKGERKAQQPARVFWRVFCFYTSHYFG